MDAERKRSLAPWAAAVAAAATVAAVVLPAGWGSGSGPGPPAPFRPAPQVLDRQAQSLDRCVGALGAAGLAAHYPERGDWRPLAGHRDDGVLVTLLDGEVPFVCATGPSVVEVSDPRAAVPVDRALLVLSTPGGVLAAVAQAGERVEVTAAGERPKAWAGDRYFVRVGSGPITDPGQLAVAIGDAGGVRAVGAPARLAPPAVRVVDRRSVPPDRSAGAADLLRRCLAEAGADPASGGWETAQVVAYRRGDQPASLLVAAGGSGVGGCSVAPGEVTPFRPWGPGVADGDARPFNWLGPLPDLGPDLVGGPVRAEVVRMEVAARDGPLWQVVVAGGTFAGQAPPGAPADPRALTVRAFDADDALLWEGPAAG
ncbi:hypothetical protein [Pseudonocardia humida]|uniref:Uncharacterized protein n=1 Tax=Pseudonocardia humida TaxID=2800819 RepID=A0ABT0ZY63_9PSEU|nr:hypothetical protein [Pseudonocardia humida]MCO1655610.1 hypothetical protein [Pseudonocardia humida]